MTDHNPEFGTQVRTIQIIVAALVVGCVTFGGIACVIAGDDLAFREFGVLAIVATAFAAGAVVVSTVVRVVFDKQADRDAPQPADKLLSLFQNRAIVSAAVLEGATFLNLIVVIVENNAASLVTAGVLIAIMLIRLPTKRGIAEWVAKRLDASQTTV
ncbi:MAG: hypothetical protein AAF532_09935 [Planctomycetota bacterium]